MTATAPSADSKRPAVVTVAVGLLALGGMYVVFWALNPFTGGGLIYAALDLAFLGYLILGLLRRSRRAWLFAIAVVGVSAVLGGLVQLTTALVGRAPVATYPPFRSAALVVYGLGLTSSLLAPVSRQWFRTSPSTPRADAGD